MSGNVPTVEVIHEALLGDDGVISGDPERGRLIAEVFAQVAEPDFECVMIGPDEAFRNAARGIEGFFAAWEEWVSPFEGFRIEVEEIRDGGDCVVDFVRMTARTSRGGVPVESEGAAVWCFRDGHLHRVEFRLDREAALRIAGLEP